MHELLIFQQVLAEFPHFTEVEASTFQMCVENDISVINKFCKDISSII